MFISLQRRSLGFPIVSSEDVKIGTAPRRIARAAALCSIAAPGARRLTLSRVLAGKRFAGAFMTHLEPSAAHGAASRNRLLLLVYTAAIFVSALLLFSVQPLFTKMVLPRLGGSPAVWSVAMVFFQSLLLAGYAYAHYLMRLNNRRIAVTAHLVLLLVALFTLPLSIAASWGDPPTSGYALWLLGLFAASIRIFSMPLPISAASWRFCPIRCCLSRCSRCGRRT
jgi:hypothetical protein